MISKRRRATSALLFVLFVLPVLADTLEGRAVRVIDGDTVVVLDVDRTQHRIRLAGIDAPEHKQPFGQKSKRYPASLIAGQDVVVDWHKHDGYHRIVGKIIHGGQDVDLAMVRAGLAWRYRKYAHEQSPADRVLYEEAENKAKANRRTLWIDFDPMPAWEWRDR